MGVIFGRGNPAPLTTHRRAFPSGVSWGQSLPSSARQEGEGLGLYVCVRARAARTMRGVCRQVKRTSKGFQCSGVKHEILTLCQPCLALLPGRGEWGWTQSRAVCSCPASQLSSNQISASLSLNDPPWTQQMYSALHYPLAKGGHTCVPGGALWEPSSPKQC